MITTHTYLSTVYLDTKTTFELVMIITILLFSAKKLPSEGVYK